MQDQFELQATHEPTGAKPKLVVSPTCVGGVVTAVFLLIIALIYSVEGETRAQVPPGSIIPPAPPPTRVLFIGNR